MKNLLLFFTLLCTAYFSNAQQNQKKPRNIEEHKKKFIEQRIEIKESNKSNFWATYDRYNNKRKDLRIKREQNRLSMQKSEISESEAQTIISNELAVKQEELALEKNYIRDLQQVISNKEILSFLKAEREFNKMVLKRLAKERREGQRN